MQVNFAQGSYFGNSGRFLLLVVEALIVEMDNIIDQIKSTSLFGQLDTETIQNCLESGEFIILSYAKNAVIHFESETANKLEIVLNGKVAVEHIDESGELLSITELFHNDILGGNLLFSDHPVYPMTITAQLPTVVLAVEREALFRLLSENPDFLRVYLSSISGRTQILGYKIKNYTNKTIRQCIQSYLDYESKRQNSKRILLNITKKELAEKFGVQRTSLSRELNKMKQDGLIQFDKVSITILD